MLAKIRMDHFQTMMTRFHRYQHRKSSRFGFFKIHIHLERYALCNTLCYRGSKLQKIKWE